MPLDLEPCLQGAETDQGDEFLWSLQQLIIAAVSIDQTDWIAQVNRGNRSHLVLGILASVGAAAFSPPIDANPNSPTDEFVVDASGTVDAVVNDKPARVLYRSVGSRVPIFNPGSLDRLHLSSGLLGARISFRVGPIQIAGNSGVAQYSVGGKASRRTVGWFERDIAPGFDALLGPMAIDYPVVTQRLHPAVSGEKVITFGLSTFGYMGAGVVLRIKPLTVMQFDPASATTVANAPFANDVAPYLHAYFEGEIHSRHIAFGVERPVRTMRLSSPLSFGPLKVDHMEVRVVDSGGTSAVPESEPDPDEIVVVATGKPDKRLRYLIVGADALRTCSSITFDKPRHQVRLSCLPS